MKIGRAMAIFVRPKKFQKRVNKKPFLVSFQKWPKNTLSWFFLTRLRIFVRQTKIAITQSNLQIFANFFSSWELIMWISHLLLIPLYPTLNDWDMAKICSAGVLAPLTPPKSPAQDNPLDRVKVFFKKTLDIQKNPIK